MTMPTDRLTRDSIRLSKLLLWALVVAVSLTATSMLASITTSYYSDFEQLSGAGMLVCLFCVQALGCAVVAEHGRAVGFMRSGIIAGAMALLGWLSIVFYASGSGDEVVTWPTAWAGLLLVVGVLLVSRVRVKWWCMLRTMTIVLLAVLAAQIALLGWLSIVVYASGSGEDLWPKVVTWLTAWACLMLVVGVLLLPRVTVKWWRSLRIATIVLLAMLSAHIALAVSFAPEYSWRYEEMAFRSGAAIALLAAGGIVTTFITAWTLRLSGAVGSQREFVPFWLTCPRCGAEQEGVTEGYACRQCRLRIRVQRP